jgi:hypothetical protein
MNHSLPTGFESLEPLLSQWALPAQDQRQSTRLHASTQELRAFYDVMLPLMPAALSHVDSFALDELPETSRVLFRLMLSMAEVAPHVELYRGDPKVPHSFDENRFVAEHGTLAE